MRIPLEQPSERPLYRQIETWFRHEIARGALAPGVRLPASRQLAVDLGVSRTTVTAAYAELDAVGLVVAREGSGTRVADPLPAGVRSTRSPQAPATLPAWQETLAEAYPERLSVPAPAPAPVPVPVRAPAAGGLIAFTGVGDPRSYPASELGRTLYDELRRAGSGVADYGRDPRGDLGLRETVAQLLSSQGIRADADSVLITSGSQQALALTCQVLLRPEDVVVVEDPTYDRALTLFRTLGLRVVGVPVDADGLRTDLLAEVLDRHRVGLVYVMPTFQNPTGSCLAADRRRQLIELTRERQVPVFEDDFAADLRYDGRGLPALKALDPDGGVIYAATFSKLLMPAIRVGYLVADGPVLHALTVLKHAQDLGTSALLQRTLDRFLSLGRYQAYVRRTTRLGRVRRDAVVTGLAEHLPQARVERPHGGLFVWADVGGSRPMDELLPAALAAGVGYAPGARFSPGPSTADRHVRLNFAVHTPAEIDTGLRRLAAVVDTGSR